MKDENLRDRILAVLRDKQSHSGAEFLDGRHGFRCSSYSQRIGQLIKRGYVIDRERHGDLGRYRLIAEPSDFEPMVVTQDDGQLAMAVW